MNVIKVILLTVILMASPVLMAQENVFTWRGEIEDHPRLLLKAGEEEAVAKIISEDSAIRRVHEGIIKECDLMLDLPVLDKIMEGKRLLPTSREALRRIFWLSYAYRMTCDDAYAVRAVEEMLAVSAFDDWNPSHFLDVGEMMMALAIGYDWLYDHMTSEQRRTICWAMIQKGFIPADDEEYAGFYNMANNWNQVCCAGLLYGALAIYEEDPDKAKELIDLYVKSVPFALASYAPDGGYPEGFNYWGYGTSFQVMMIAALESAMGTDFGLSSAPGFLDTATFIQFMTAPSGECFNFSDAVPYAPCNPAMFWFASKTNEPEIVWQERKKIDNLTDDFMSQISRLFTEHRLLPSLIIYCSRMDMDGIRPPQEKIRTYDGRTPLFIYRSGWEDSDDVYLGIKGGSPMTSHAHMDAGSFVYEYGGVRWSVDLGLQDYHYLESRGIGLWDQSQTGQRWEVFRLGNDSHSTLTLNGKHHVVKSFVPLTQVWQEDGRKGARLDMTSAFASDADSLVREIWLDQKDHLHVRDCIRTGDADVEVQWIMATSAEVEVCSDDALVLTKDGKRMILKMETDGQDVKAKVWSNNPRNEYDAPNPGTCRVGFVVSVPEGSQTSLNVTLKPCRL